MDTNNDLATLFETYHLGDLTLPNKLVMASLTRIRADPKTGIPNDLFVEYYSQRASAGLIITECSAISNQGNTFPGCGCIYTKEQTEGWKRVVERVHSKGGRIGIQIWHGGRSADPEAISEEIIAPSAIAIRGKKRGGADYATPRAMTKEDIEMVKQQFRQGALNAKEAGFDVIELHGANGYLVDQFLRDGSNKRTDEYGGSIENRCRFALEVIDILIEIFGKKRVGIKLSPVGRFQDMYDSDPVATFGYLLQELDKKGIAYVQLMEPNEHYKGDVQHDAGEKQIAHVSKTFRQFFKGTIMINNNLTPETAAQAISSGDADIASFGRYFISNPDFVERVKNKYKYNEWDPKTFYGGNEKGYTDYAFYGSEEETSA